MIKELKGYNIIRIENLISKTVENKEYIMILTEKAILRDLGKLNNSYFFLYFQNYHQDYYYLY